jgi:hypothetical protein
MQPASQPAPDAAQTAAAPNLRQVLDPYVQRQCQGSFSYNIQNLAFGDLDGDGQTDILLDWGEVRCQGPIGPRPFCGAANCSIDILLSSKNYAPGEGYLGVGVRTVALNDGRTGFLMGGTANVCATGACDIPFVWDGTKFRKLY